MPKYGPSTGKQKMWEKHVVTPVKHENAVLEYNYNLLFR